MLVNKRRPGQGIVFGGVLDVTVEDITHGVWMRAAAESIGAPVRFSTRASEPGCDTVLLGVRSPVEVAIDGTRTALRVDPSETSTLWLERHLGDRVEIGGLAIGIDQIAGGDHAGKPLLHLEVPGLGAIVDLAVLTVYSYAVDLAAQAPQSMRIHRSELWARTAAANESAARWTADSLSGLQAPRPERTPLSA